MKKKVWKSCLLLCFGYLAQLHAQDPTVNGGAVINDIVPPSPNPSSLGVYGDYAVDLYTGLPSINIPLLDVSFQDLHVPINVSYHASGVKVDDVASWVGLGWALKAGGVITRTIRGGPDDDANGFWANANSYPSPTNGIQTNTQSGYNLANLLYTKHIDTQPDDYYYNFGENSGRFLIDPDHTCHPVPFNNMKFEYGTFDGISGVFKVTDGTGTMFYFEDVESTDASDPSGNETIGASTWHLTKIVSAQHNAEIDFHYDDYTTGVEMTRQATLYFDRTNGAPDYAAGPGFGVNAPTSISYFAKRLSKITWSTGSVVFAVGAPRTDLSGDFSLGSISSFNSDNNLLKSFSFAYNNDFSGRLMLQSITENANDGVSASKPPYVFAYDPNSLPPRGSFAQDHWGFYNGAGSNATLIPQYTEDNTYYYPLGGNREPDFNSTKAEVLTQISYPTGGTTQFEYEQNLYGYNSADQPVNDTPPISNSLGVNAKVLGQVNEATNQKTFSIAYAQTFQVNVNRQISGAAPGNVANVTIQVISGSPLSDLTTNAAVSSTGPTILDPGSHSLKTSGPGTYQITAFADNETKASVVSATAGVTYYTTGTLVLKNEPGPGLRICMSSN